MVIALVGCGTTIESVTLPESITLNRGDEFELVAAFGAGDASQEKIDEAVAKLNPVWTSSDEAVATVSESGVVTALSNGECVICVTAGELSAQTTVVVQTAVDRILLSEDALTIEEGQTATVEVALLPEDATLPDDATISYTSSDDEIATVNETEDGFEVIGVAEGSVTVEVVYGDLKATCEVTVEAAPEVVEPETTTQKTTTTASKGNASSSATTSSNKGTSSTASAATTAPATTTTTTPSVTVPETTAPSTESVTTTTPPATTTTTPETTTPAVAPSGGGIGRDLDETIPGGGVFDTDAGAYQGPAVDFCETCESWHIPGEPCL